MRDHRADLLRVLERPEVPLHNNAVESDIREFVKRRKISGGTRNDAGRRCRDTFASLKKTCRKLGIRFWDYLQDRVRGLGKIPRLADLIRQKAQRVARPQSRRRARLRSSDEHGFQAGRTSPRPSRSLRLSHLIQGY